MLGGVVDHDGIAAASVDMSVRMDRMVVRQDVLQYDIAILVIGVGDQ